MLNREPSSAAAGKNRYTAQLVRVEPRLGHRFGAARGGMCLAIACFGCCLCLSGCRSDGGAPRAEQGRPLPALSASEADELSADLDQFSETALQMIETAGSKVERDAPTGERRAALRWRLNSTAELHAEEAELEPVARILDLWALFTRLRNYYTVGDGKELFGENQHVVVETSTKLVEELEDIARRHLSEDHLREVVRAVDAYARSNPITGDDLDRVSEELTSQQDGNKVLNWIISSPGRTLGAAGRTLDPTRSLAVAVDRFTEVAEHYPRMMRWELKLLWLDLERTELSNTLKENTDRVGRASERMAATAEQLPEELRQQVAALVDDIELSQSELQKTLKEARSTSAEFASALERAQGVTASVEQVLGDVKAAAPALSTAADSVSNTVEQIQILAGRHPTIHPPDRKPTEPADEAKRRPFDINDYRLTIEALESSGTELRGLLAEFRETLASDEIPKQVAQLETLTNELIASSQQASRNVVDHAAWRAGQLIVVFLVLSILAHWAKGKRPMDTKA